MTKIFVAGHHGMVGRSICRILAQQPDINLVTRTRNELDLCNQQAVQTFMNDEKPDEVILAAAKVGGIYANNTYRAEFIYQNLQIQNNVIHSAHLNNVHKLLFLGSSCIYPKSAAQPIQENALLTGTLEPTNEPYSIAKIAGIKMCESYNIQYGRDYRAVMPTNLYGPGDNYHPQNSHVIPGLFYRFHHAKTNKEPKVTIWGSGRPKREFMYVEDMAAASLFIHNLDKKSWSKRQNLSACHVNVGVGADITIRDLALKIKEIVAYKGEIDFDLTQMDGTPQKLLDNTVISSLGWAASVSLDEGLKQTYASYVAGLMDL